MRPAETRTDIEVVVVLEDGSGGQESLVAGLPATSRILIEAARAGAKAAYVVPIGPKNLARTIRNDLSRAGCRLTIHWLDPYDIVHALESQRPAGVTVLTRGAIVGAESLRRLAQLDQSGVLLCDGQPLAIRYVGREPRLPGFDLALEACGPRLKAVASEPGESIALARPAAATREVLRRTGKDADGLVSRWLNRPLSRFMSACVLTWPGVRPNHLTWTTLLVALAMFACLTLGGAAGLVAGGLLFQLASVVDGVDGEIARATFRTSQKGAALDTAVDMATNLMFVLGLTIGLGRLHGAAYWLVGGAGFLVFFTGVAALAWLVRRSAGGASFDLLKVVYARRFAGSSAAGAVTAVRTVMSRDFFAFAFAVLAVAGLSWVIPWAFAIAALIWLGAIAAAAPSVLATGRPSLALLRADQPSSASSVSAVRDDRAATQGKRAAAVAS